MLNFVQNSILLILVFTLGIIGCEEDSASNGNGDDIQYTVTTLPSLGGTISTANAINNQGWVAGFSNLPGDSTRHATLWKDGMINDLGTLGGPNSRVAWPGLNNKGMVVGITEMAEMDSLGQRFSCWAFFPTVTGHVCRGFVWESGEMTPMPTLGGINSYAVDINNQGQVVGWAETDVKDPTCDTDFQTLQFRGVLWEPKQDQIQELIPLPGDSVSTGNAINSKGQIIGISGDCGIAVGGVSARHAALWENGTPTEIGNLGGVNWHTPADINEQGVVVGFSNPENVVDGSFRPHAFLWTKSNGIQDLGTLPGDTESQALGINERGQVVGASYIAGDTTDVIRAVLWQEDGTIVDLNTLIEPDFSGHLLDAGYINDAGMITGTALDSVSGDNVTFIATPIDKN